MTEKLTAKMLKDIRIFMKEKGYTDPHEALYIGATLTLASLTFFINDIEKKLQSKSLPEDMISTDFIQNAHEAKKLMGCFAANLEPLLNKETTTIMQRMSARLNPLKDENCDCENCDQKEVCKLINAKESKKS